VSDVLPFIVVGITGGAAYALLALGLVLVNNSSRILSFAHGEIGVLGALVVATLVQDAELPWPVAISAGVAAGAATSVAIRAVLFRRGSSKGSLPPLVGTIAALLMLTVVEARLLTGDAGPVRPFRSPFGGRGVTVFGAVVTPVQIAVVVSVAAICAGLWVLVERTRIGLMVRVSADNPYAARVIGLRPAAVETVTWCISGALAAVAAVFLGWVGQRAGPGFLTYALAGSFTAAILGGMASLPGAVAGGLVVGLAESLTRYWAGGTPGASQLVVFLILFAVLLFRPQGLFGRRREGVRAEGSESLVRLHSLVRVPTPPPAWRERLVRRGLPAVGLGVLGLVVVQSLDGIEAFKLSLVPVMVVLALSLNMLLSNTGQLSLAHGGLMGVGAFTTAIASTTWDFPFFFALGVGVVSTALVALVLGTAALRVRGLYLAVLTLSFAVVLEVFVFPRPEFSQGGAGLQLARPRIGPFDLADDRTFLGVALLVMAVVWLADRRLQRSPLGRAWVAIRENEAAASARGISPAGLNVAAFAVSGVGAGLAGALFALRIGHLVSLLFPLLLSFTVVLYVVLGGIGSRAGVAAMTALFTVNTIYGSGGGQGDLVLLAGAAALLVLIGFRPDGVAGLVRSLRARFEARRAGGEGAEVQAASAPVAPPGVGPEPDAAPALTPVEPPVAAEAHATAGRAS